MCRLLYIQSKTPFDSLSVLRSFSNIAQHSKKWQGDGWGVGYKKNSEWDFYRSLRPIWHDEPALKTIPTTASLFAHARGALVKGSITLEYVHPFVQGDWIFAFNGLVRGVKLQIPGGIGAVKIFNLLLKTIDEYGDVQSSIQQVSDLLVTNSESYTAINFILSNKKTGQTYIHSRYSEDPDYFAIRVAHETDGTSLACSQEFGEYQWRRMESGETVFFNKM
jgi:predicted glutamine amidotransferase